LAGLNAGIVPKVDNADQLLQDGLQFFQPIHVFMALADENKASPSRRHH
jgi:hypothetical protein